MINKLNSFSFQKAIECLFSRLSDRLSSLCHCLCLETLRLFSREKSRLGSMVSDNGLAHIMIMAGLEHYAKEGASGVGVTIQLGDPDGKCPVCRRPILHIAHM